MARFVLDSDTITYILQQREPVLARLAKAVAVNADIYLCPIVYYQVRRGLLYKGASRQLREFDSLARGFRWTEFERPMWDDVAHTWASCRRRGRPHDDDADLLIAAYARRLRATLVTNNTADFEDLGVRLANWTALRRHLLVEPGDLFGPFGAKTVGETPIVPVAGAIANAVARATAARVTSLPITPAKVLRALEAPTHPARHG